MRILFLTQYFPPEVGAPQNRIFEFAKLLKEFGHDVTVLTAMPNYPAGEIKKEYRGKITYKEDMEGLRVVRTWIYATKNAGFLHRLGNYFSFTISSILFGLPLVGNQDVVITESPPLFLGFSGYILSIFKGAKFVFNISDLWPESAVKLGVLKNKLLIDLSTWLEEFCYRKASLITCQTQGIVDNIVNRDFDPGKVKLITNGVDGELFNKNKFSHKFKESHFSMDDFLVYYAGIHGIAQGLEVIIEVAKKLKEFKDIKFVLIGDGPEKQKLIDMARSYNLDNVVFMPLQKKKDMPEIIATMDATIIPLKKLDLFKGAIPSKTYEAMASSIPVVLAVQGEAKEIISKANAGICVEPENVDEIKDAVLKLYYDRNLCKELGENGRKYVVENFSRKNITRKLERYLYDIVGQKK